MVCVQKRLNRLDPNFFMISGKIISLHPVMKQKKICKILDSYCETDNWDKKTTLQHYWSVFDVISKQIVLVQLNPKY